MEMINDLAVYTDGSTSNPAIMFVHGFPFDHFMWDNQVAALANDYFCIRYDIRGLGKSTVGNGQYTIELFVDDILAILDVLHVKQVVLCGLSMGGYIALRAMERNPERFNGLVLLDTKAEADDNNNKIRRATAVTHLHNYGSAGYVKAFVPNTMPEASINRLGDGYTRMIDRLIQASPLGIAGCQLAMLGRTETTESLKNIPVKTLVICGEHDSLSPVAQMQAMADRIPDCRFVVVEGAGHMTPLEQPDTVNTVIAEYLATL